jgi:uncharacterized protein (DUF58 family)
MKINARALALYLVCLYVSYLAGVYYASYLLALYYMLLFFPVLCLLAAVISYFGIKYHQQFSTEHPVKGQSVEYRFLLANELPLPVGRVVVQLKTVTPFRDSILPSFQARLLGSETLERHYTLHCPFRGIYTVGLERLALTDTLGLLTLSLPVFARTFYVYPRLILLRSFAQRIYDLETRGEGVSQAGLPDYALFSRLREYRSGESIRHISWKKFASAGKPYIREYEATSGLGLRIYLDLRKRPLPGVGELEQEDTSIEILVALVKYFLERGVATSVSAPGRDYYTFSAEDPERFGEFYQSTMNLVFQDTVSPALLYYGDSGGGGLRSRATIFISHILDSDILSLLEGALGAEQSITLIFNQTGYQPEERERNRAYFNRLREKGARIITVEGADTIQQDLEEQAR